MCVKTASLEIPAVCLEVVVVSDRSSRACACWGTACCRPRSLSSCAGSFSSSSRRTRCSSCDSSHPWGVSRGPLTVITTRIASEITTNDRFVRAERIFQSCEVIDSFDASRASSVNFVSISFSFHDLLGRQSEEGTQGAGGVPDVFVLLHHIVAGDIAHGDIIAAVRECFSPCTYRWVRNFYVCARPQSVSIHECISVLS